MEQFVDDDGVIELWLGQYAQKVLALLLGEALDTQCFDALEKTIGCEKFVDLTLDLGFENLLGENVTDRGSTLLDNFLRDLEKYLLSYIYHLIFVDILSIFLFLGHLLVIHLRSNILIYLVMIVIVLKNDFNFLDALIVEVI